MKPCILGLIHLLLVQHQISLPDKPSGYRTNPAQEVPKEIGSFFAPPEQLAHDFGAYMSQLTFRDGTPIRTSADWQRRREEISATWRSMIGLWPPLVEKPKIQYLEQKHRDNFTQHRVSVEITPDEQTVGGYPRTNSRV
jgi:hypothetical protein